MKAYIRSYEEIKKNGIEIDSYIYVKGHCDGPAFIPEMKSLCEKGPFEFKALYISKEYFRGESWDWHISWLNPILKNKQYLLEF